MTKAQYLKALDDLRLTVASQSTARVLGVSVRQVQRYASGDAEIPETLALLLAMYQKHGIPRDWR